MAGMLYLFSFSELLLLFASGVTQFRLRDQQSSSPVTATSITGAISQSCYHAACFSR